MHERDGCFLLGTKAYNHPAVAGLQVVTKIRATAEEKGLQYIFCPAVVVVNNVLLDDLDDAPCEALLPMQALERAVNCQ